MPFRGWVGGGRRREEVYCHGEEDRGEGSRDEEGVCVPWESRVSSMAEAGGDLQGEIGVY